MLRFRLTKRRLLILESPVYNEREFFKIVFQLQNCISGTASIVLLDDDKVLQSIRLGVRPSFIFNHATNKNCSFDEFYNNPFSFAYIDRLKYAYWIKDKIILDTIFTNLPF